jgi:hypothetical protein
MDILNWLYLRKEQLIRKTANNAETDLVALGADATFAKRGDQYQTYAMTVQDLSVAGDVANTGYYTLDLGITSVVNVTTQKGVIDIAMDETNLNPLPAFFNSVGLYIQNADMDFTDLDKVYIQFSTYYSPAMGDNFIPYVLSTGGAPTGINLSIFNANPAPAGLGQFKGKMYLYYELYNV